MGRRSDLGQRIVLLFLSIYATVGGLTGSGMNATRYKFANLLILTILVIGWLVIRWRRHWTWYRSPLDRVIILWLLAFGLSFVANLDSWRRITIGLWYVLTYIGLWYILHDMLANKFLKREILVESLLIAGLVAMVTSYSQFFYMLPGWLAQLRVGAATLLDVPRPFGTLDNPNLLASFLVLVLPLAAERFVSAGNWLLRVTLAAYLVLGLALQLPTFSRGGWFGTLVGLGVCMLLLLAHYRLLSRQRLVAWWRSQTTSVRVVVAGASLLTILAVAGVGFITLRSLNAPGRTVDLRTDIYDVALRMFADKPVAGNGLFTFGKGLLKYRSTPPNDLHSHSHDLPLNVASEMGIVGLIALTLTVIAIGRAMRHNWQVAGQNKNSAERFILIGAIASALGFAAHQLLDVTAMVVLIALGGLMVLSIAITPLTPVPAGHRQRQLQLVALVGLWIVLIISGIWSSGVYNTYVMVLYNGTQTGDYPGTVQGLQAVINADPGLAIYTLSRGYFEAVAVYKGDSSFLPGAIEDYKRFCAIEPYYAPAWADLGALYWQAGQRDEAIKAMQQAVAVAPLAWALPINLARYQEAVGNLEAARQAYQRALTLYPDASLYPDWQTTALGQDFAANNPHYTGFAQAIRAYVARNVDKANILWSSVDADIRRSPSGRVFSLYLALERKDRAAAVQELGQIKPSDGDPISQAWLDLGIAQLAQFDGDQATADREIKQVQNYIMPGPLDGIDDRVGAIAYAQYLRVGAPRYYIPQVYAPLVDPMLLQLCKCGRSNDAP